MMHRCSMGQCTCGLFHSSQTNSFTMLFSNHYESDHMYQYHPFPSSSSSSSSSSSPVDCTLSLGTPSTRLCEDDEKRTSRSTSSSFCWEILQTKNTPPYTSSQPHKTNTRSTSNTNDPLLARRCANCDTTSTPLWRNGPRGPKSLCNACGIRFKKEERRATAANGGNGSITTAASISMEQQYYGYGNNSKMGCFSPANEFRFIEESDRDSDSSAIPFLSWTLNRPSLVHDFTR